MPTNFDFGFNSEEFKGEQTLVPYAQFINRPSQAKNWGIAIKEENAEVAGFKPDKTFRTVTHNFNGEEDDTKLFLTQAPRILVLNKSVLLMTNKADRNKIIAYDRDIVAQESGWSYFTYYVLFFVGEDNTILSDLPFRIKCGGQAGLTFGKWYNNYKSPKQSFRHKFAYVYQQLTGDNTPKNDIFYAHAVYCPKLEKKTVTSSKTGESSQAVLTEGFEVPPVDENFKKFIIPRNEKILQAIEDTKTWVKIESVQEEYDHTPPDEPIDESNNNGKVNEYEPIPF